MYKNRSDMRSLSIFLITCLLPLWGIAENIPRVVATASMIADMAQEIGGDYLDVKCIVPIGGDPHVYRPKPSDAALVSKADLVLMNGLTFEGWLEELVRNSGTEAPLVLVTDGITPISSEVYENAPDPHVWMDASLAIKYIVNIKNAFIQLVPEHQAAIEANYERYKKELEELDAYIQAQIQSIPAEKRILVTSHDAFQYYGHRYGIRLEAVKGVSTEAEVQTSDMRRIEETIKASKVPALFVESTIDPKLLQQIAKDNGVIIGGKLYADSIGPKDSPASSYTKMMRYNTDTIVKALTGQVTKDDVEENAPASSNWILYTLIGALFLGGFFMVARKMG